MGSEHFLLPPRDHPREGALAREPEVLALKLIQCPVMRRGRKMVLLLSPCMWALLDKYLTLAEGQATSLSGFADARPKLAQGN